VTTADTIDKRLTRFGNEELAIIPRVLDEISGAVAGVEEDLAV
jgi:hypothetical protein